MLTGEDVSLQAAQNYEPRLVKVFEPPGLNDTDLGRARFIIRAWLWSTPLLLMMLGLYIWNDMGAQVVVQSLTIVGAIAVLAALRFGMPLNGVIDASLTVVTLSFIGTALGQTPFDPSVIFFLSIVPLAAGFAAGMRRGMSWAFISALSGVVALQLGQRGYTFSDPDRDIAFTMSLNLVFQLGLSVLYAKMYTDERERSLSKARAADRAKSVFLANVSHEIRTPMNGVVGMTEVLLQSELSVEQREQLEVVQRSGQALVLLINDLLDFARLEEGRLELAPVPFDLRMLVDDLGKLYAPLAQEKKIALTLSVALEVPSMVQGDALRLRQVLSNLLSNAVKFTVEGTVCFEVNMLGDRVQFAVVDTGPGIPASVRPRLFHRFEQGDASATRRAGGTGLGLALSREFVRLMGGSLEHDASYTQGSRFSFSVQLKVAGTTKAIPAIHKMLPRLRGLSKPVLVVDDNPVNLAVARGLLGRAGYQVQTAVNGREAVKAAQSGSWGLVLMDMQMPEMDGLEATRQIRALSGEAGKVPVIALTASAMPEDFAACLQSGMNDVLAKPIDVTALLSVLSRYALVETK